MRPVSDKTLCDTLMYYCSRISLCLQNGHIANIISNLERPNNAQCETIPQADVVEVSPQTA